MSTGFAADAPGGVFTLAPQNVGSLLLQARPGLYGFYADWRAGIGTVNYAQPLGRYRVGKRASAFASSNPCPARW